jgi:hypothetical protein
VRPGAGESRRWSRCGRTGSGRRRFGAVLAVGAACDARLTLAVDHVAALVADVVYDPRRHRRKP